MEESIGRSGSVDCLPNLSPITNFDSDSLPAAPERAKEVEVVSEKKDADCVARYRTVNYDTRNRAPRRKEPTEKSKEAWKRKERRIVEIALKFLNKSKKAKKVGEYEIVETIGVQYFRLSRNRRWFHAGFQAKPKNAPEAEIKTFFSELKSRPPGPIKCIKCCLLGPLDHGYHGCYVCKRSGLAIHHPLSGFRNGFPPFLL